MIWMLVGLGILYLLHMSSRTLEQSIRQIGYSEFFRMVEGNETTGLIDSAVQTEKIISGTLSDGTRFQVDIPDNDPELLSIMRTNIHSFDISPPKTFWANMFYSFMPIILFVGLMWFLFYRGAAQGGGRILSFGKSRARLVSGTQLKTTFKDAAGVEEAKEELQEVIEFLKNPKKFQRLGGKMPKGILLMGPPGTGKTLLAKAVSGEAGVPFFSISGSDFVEMFVGVGASRVRDLFEQAKKSVKQSQKGCIIFIDEIDAVGRQRFAGIGGGHDEREQTLNALLVEMDGFDTTAGVILIAATNRPDVLDPALLRPGRFDRQIVIDMPDINGREAILKVHMRNIKAADSIDLKSIARQTPGFTGADLANLANEGALLGARRDKEAVTMEELEEARERVMAGPERKSRVISEYEKKVIAYHESGHSLVSLLIPEADPLHKVSIIPRGTAALGYTMQVPSEDRYIVTQKELNARLTVLLGGRASEELILNESTTGAHNDLEVATTIARKMVCQFGMSDKLGNVTLGRHHQQVFLGRDIMEEKNYSEETAQVIDSEVKRIIDECYDRATKLLDDNKDKLDKLTKHLLEKETLDSEEVRELLGLKLESKDKPKAKSASKEEKKEEKKG
ncbi:MAG: ATP-dependent metallopeptidase FtsH/Yme1/Tma family protein [Candidatus Omnitrophica bacterium]|nr:ATP-dependent metallopeptidase FtsH/Yme1/Tma family protein [Candidatus Omnitrophota bacterium]